MRWAWLSSHCDTQKIQSVRGMPFQDHIQRTISDMVFVSSTFCDWLRFGSILKSMVSVVAHSKSLDLQARLFSDEIQSVFIPGYFWDINFTYMFHLAFSLMASVIRIKCKILDIIFGFILLDYGSFVWGLFPLVICFELNISTYCYIPNVAGFSHLLICVNIIRIRMENYNLNWIWFGFEPD